MTEQLTKREQIAAMLAAAWVVGPYSARTYSDDTIEKANKAATQQADDLLRRLKETEKSDE